MRGNRPSKRGQPLLALAAFVLASCASAPAPVSTNVLPDGTVVLSGKTDSGAGSDMSPVSAGNPGGTALAVPSREELKKNALDQTTLSLLQIGSPEAIREAVGRINSDSRGMTEQNRLALALAGELMRILYPLEAVTWPTPSVPDGDNYLAIVKSARLGVYDFSAGNSDYLSLVLPSLVLYVSPVMGDWADEADASLEKAASLNKKSVLAPLFRALIAERRGKLADAETQYRRAWDLDSSCYPAGVSLSRILSGSGRGDEALSISRILLARYPESLAMTRLCAEAAFSMRRWDEADQYVLSILKADPNDAPYLLLRARILVERKDYLKANALLDAFATTNRTDKSYLLLRSRVAREWNRNAVSATGFLREAIRLYPEDLEVLLASAEVAYQTGQDFQRRTGRDLALAVLQRESTNRQALSLLVADFLQAQEWPDAVRYAERLVSLGGGLQAKVELARAYLGSGKASSAVTLARSLYAESPASDQIVSIYLQALLQTGDATGAHAVIEARLPDASSSLKSILYYYESRLVYEPDSRLAVLRSSLLADPRNPLALFAMYEWYLERKDYRKAQYYLKQVIALEPGNGRYLELSAKLDDLLAR